MDWVPIDAAAKSPLTTRGDHRYGPRLLLDDGNAFTGSWWETDIGRGGSNFLDDGGNARFPTHYAIITPPEGE